MYQKGDILKFKRCFGLYYHYVIYLENDKVIHLDKQWNGKANICVTDLKDIPGRVMHSVISCPSLTNIEEAMQMQGPAYYNVFTNNCEHFVNQVKYNRRFSRQVNRLKRLCIGVLAALVITKSAQSRCKSSAVQDACHDEC